MNPSTSCQSSPRDDLPIPTELLRGVLLDLHPYLHSEPTPNIRPNIRTNIGMTSFSRLALVARRWAGIIQELLCLKIILMDQAFDGPLSVIRTHFEDHPEQVTFVKRFSTFSGHDSYGFWEGMIAFLQTLPLLREIEISFSAILPEKRSKLPFLPNLQKLSIGYHGLDGGPLLRLSDIVPDFPRLLKLRSVVLHRVDLGLSPLLESSFQLQSLTLSNPHKDKRFATRAFKSHFASSLETSLVFLSMNHYSSELDSLFSNSRLVELTLHPDSNDEEEIDFVLPTLPLLRRLEIMLGSRMEYMEWRTEAEPALGSVIPSLNEFFSLRSLHTNLAIRGPTIVDRDSAESSSQLLLTSLYLGNFECDVEYLSLVFGPSKNTLQGLHLYPPSVGAWSLPTIIKFFSTPLKSLRIHGEHKQRLLKSTIKHFSSLKLFGSAWDDKIQHLDKLPPTLEYLELWRSFTGFHDLNAVASKVIKSIPKSQFPNLRRVLLEDLDEFREIRIDMKDTPLTIKEAKGYGETHSDRVWELCEKHILGIDWEIRG